MGQVSCFHWLFRVTVPVSSRLWGWFPLPGLPWTPFRHQFSKLIYLWWVLTYYPLLLFCYFVIIKSKQQRNKNEKCQMTYKQANFQMSSKLKSLWCILEISCKDSIPQIALIYLLAANNKACKRLIHYLQFLHFFSATWTPVPSCRYCM